MLKKILIVGILSLFYFICYSNPIEDNSPTVAPVAEQTDVMGEETLLPTSPDSRETNTIEESAVARKMTQAEKAENAKENDSWGGAITLIAMTVVISALVVLSLLFLIFGQLSSAIMAFKKKKVKTARSHIDAHEDHEVDSGEAIAAIAMALTEHFEAPHDLEDTILTIRRMRKSYSPWNSKIYNMTHTPELHHNVGSHSAFSIRK